ncbi:MAG: adenosylcobinamide-GDP ribazoletransferase [Candidatus Schekmanbacteria bacterium]|nr:adenosylcobinamide-GDP ribazoletransferase [Candidatus Schekmanbacteria bacterium]
MRRLTIALQFLTRLPLKITPNPTPEEIGRSMVYFPLAGLLLGGYLVLVNQIVTLLLPALPASILLVMMLTAATGAMHLDGLADMVDGFYAGCALPPGEARQERILTVMKDSRIGAMGALAIFFSLILKIAGIYSLPATCKNSILLLTPMLSRWNMVWAAALSDYARRPVKGIADDQYIGLGETFHRFINSKELIKSSLLPVLLSLILLNINGLILLIVSMVTALGLINYIKNKIGGMTGDTFGAINEISENIILLTSIVLITKHY